MKVEIASCRLEDFPKFALVQRQLLQVEGTSYLILASLQQTPHRRTSCSVRCRQATPEEVAAYPVMTDDRQRRELIHRLSHYFPQFVERAPEIEQIFLSA